jgi:hypothetical protein
VKDALKQRVRIDRFEPLPDAKQEDADHHQRDTEKPTEISTTSHIPLAPVAARISPFSSDMKPTPMETALRPTTILKRPSSTAESAKARPSRASASASLAIRSHLGQRGQRHAR